MRRKLEVVLTVLVTVGVLGLHFWPRIQEATTHTKELNFSYTHITLTPKMFTLRAICDTAQPVVVLQKLGTAQIVQGHPLWFTTPAGSTVVHIDSRTGKVTALRAGWTQIAVRDGHEQATAWVGVLPDTLTPKHYDASANSWEAAVLTGQDRLGSDGTCQANGPE